MGPPARDGSAPSRYVQAVPIFLKSDAAVSQYFRESRDEIDAITGQHLNVLVAKEVTASDAAGVAAALTADPSARFAGLGFGDLPCLWIEDGHNRTAVIKLPHTVPEVIQMLRTLTDVCRETKDAPEIKERVEARLEADASERSAESRALQKGSSMKKSTERLLALIFGVVFVAAILAIALIIPEPSGFQYTVFRIVLALAAAGFVSMTPGFIEAQVGTFVRAGGALAVFAVVYFYAPAALPAAQ